MDREELSVVVVGKMITGDIAPTAVNANDLLSPYREIAEIIQSSRNWDTNLLIEDVGYYAVDKAVIAAGKTNGLPANWPKLLRNSAVYDDAGVYFDNVSKQLRAGRRVSAAEIIQQAYKLEGGKRTLMSAAEIAPETTPWRPTFWKPWDNFIGGYPESGLTVIGAPPGTGKSSLLIKLATSAAKQAKTSMIFTMEMTGGQLVYRMNQVHKIPKKLKKHIIICDEIMTAANVASMATLVPKELHFIGVDFAELMLMGGSDRSEGIMAQIYTTLVHTAKQLNTPIVLLSQLSRAYVGGMPEISHLRYTGMAEALASLIILIYNKGAIFVRQDAGGALPTVKGKAWLIVGKSRYGNIARQGGRFAIQVDWDGAKGWGDHGTVHPL